jgi:hypothetical protein
MELAIETRASYAGREFLSRMQLSDFISETLVQITNGIETANKQLAGSTARVNPAHTLPHDEKYSTAFYGTIQSQNPPYPVVHLIRFDVAVYASEGAEKKGGIGLMVGAIGIGGQAKSEAAASTTSRIQFGIPMLLPTSKSQ